MILLIGLAAVTTIFIIYILSDLLISLIDEKREYRRQRNDCNYCYYFKDGKCESVFETLCRQNNKMMWKSKNDNG